MCNGKGYDIAYYPDGSLEILQHFCRVFGDCGSRDTSLKEIAERCAEHWDQIQTNAEQQAIDYRNMTHENLKCFLDQEKNKDETI
jgi:hypothetical protein